MMNQLEKQLKRTNPNAYSAYQNARNNNANPDEFLKSVTDNFNDDQKKQWSNMMNQYGINTK